MPHEPSNKTAAVRLDKWLWCARFYKTRREALESVNTGKVKLDGKRVKPSRSVNPGEIYNIRRGPFTWTITVNALSTQRLPATGANRLYEEHPDSLAKRTQLQQQLKIDAAIQPRPRGRPGKRDRRQIIRFTRKKS